MCRLVPIWIEALAHANRRAVAVLPLRPPLEVVASLQRRDSFSRPHALALWLQHVLLAERDTRAMPRCFTLYDDLLNDWWSVSRRIDEELGLTWPHDRLQFEEQIDAFLSSELRHHHSVSNDTIKARDALQGLCMRAWEALKVLVTDARDVEAQTMLDEVSHELDAAVSVFGPLVASRERCLVQVSNRLIARDQDIAALNQTIAERDQTIAERDQTIAERDAHVIALKSSTSWRITAPIRAISSRVPTPLLRVSRCTLKIALWMIAPHRMPERVSFLLTRRKVAKIASTEPFRPLKMPDMFSLRDFRPSTRIAVVAHVFYPELYEELLDAVELMSEPFDLFVTLVEGTSDHLVDLVLARFPDAHVWCFPNRGRDILPFMTIAATGALSDYALVCKIHTKRSPHLADGEAKRRQLLSGILPNSEGIAALIAAFDADPDLGLVVANGYIFEGKEFWDGNIEHLKNLLPLIGHTVEQATRLPFAGGSIFWLRPLILRELVGLNLTPEDYEPEPIPPDGTLAHAVERLFTVACHSAGLRVEQASHALATVAVMPPVSAPRVVAFYLPQFHPTPENDRWWGRGFTEWTNVTKAKPMFPGHRQPRLPGELGFTDLRLPETRAAQADLARAYGVSAFCYYYYWFGEGRRLLHRPLDDVLASGNPDFPFMICWANEPWSWNWDGINKEVLVAQDYPEGWIEAFARDIAPILRDPRYVRLDGPGNHPMLMFYRIMHVPRPAESMTALRTALRNMGIGEVHLSAGWFSHVDD